MSEIRKHYFLEEHCIIASGRSKRPSAPKVCESEEASSDCVFCAGSEDRTPPATAVYKNGEILQDSDKQNVKDWNIRCIPNLFPALSPDAKDPDLSDFTVSKGYGFHEVIIENPSHDNRIHLSSDEEILLLMQAYQDRVKYYQAKDGIKYVSLFKNWGKKAGASLPHTHSQLIAVPLMPSCLSKEMDVIKKRDICPYCDIVKKERGMERLIYENEYFIAIAPYFSMVPYEILILPIKHINHLSALTDEMLLSLGDCIRYSVSRLDETIPELTYNYMFFQLEHEEEYHFNVRIKPVTSIAAGFEKNTGIYINAMPPEIAVDHLLNRD